MLKKIFFIFFISSKIFALHFSIELQTNYFYIGERISLSIKVIDDNNNTYTNYTGYVKLESDNPLLKIRGENPDGDELNYDNSGYILLSKGISGNIFIYSYSSGNFILKIYEEYKNTDVFLETKSISYSVRDSDKDIIINEIMFKTIDDDFYEYIELYNNSSKDIDISSLEIYSMTTKTDKNIIATNFSGIIFPSYNFLLIVKNKKQLKNIFPNIENSKSIVIENQIKNFNSSAQILIVLDNKVEDTFEYESDWVSDYNHSLARINYNDESFIENSWKESYCYSDAVTGFSGTPGCENSVSYKNEKLNIYLNANKIFEDNINIEYSVNNYGKVNISVLNSKGIKIKNLIKEQEISKNKNYNILWNGKDEYFNLLPTGIYIIYLEYINSNSGLVENKAINVIKVMK